VIIVTQWSNPTFTRHFVVNKTIEFTQIIGVNNSLIFGSVYCRTSLRHSSPSDWPLIPSVDHSSNDCTQNIYSEFELLQRNLKTESAEIPVIRGLLCALQVTNTTVILFRSRKGFKCNSCKCTAIYHKFTSTVLLLTVVVSILLFYFFFYFRHTRLSSTVKERGNFIRHNTNSNIMQ